MKPQAYKLNAEFTLKNRGDYPMLREEIRAVFNEWERRGLLQTDFISMEKKND